jgi:multidrug resistance efflux pump
MNTGSTENEVTKDVKEAESLLKRIFTSSWTLIIVLVIVLLAIGGGIAYWKVFLSRVSIDDAIVTAPSISLSPDNTGILEEVYVQEGDMIPANTPVARVGNEIVKTVVPSLVIDVPDTIGMSIPAGTAVVTVIDPTQLRVVGTLDEDKGLADIKVGQQVEFTVDTFGSQKFQGVVDEISPDAHAGDIVFNISDERQVSQYDVKVRFDTNAYPQIKDGMSAKMVIYKN